MTASRNSTHNRCKRDTNRNRGRSPSCAAIAGTTLASTDVVALSGDLLRMELSYTFLASATIGAIVGGLSGKLGEDFR